MADVRPVDANELLKESIYCTGPDGSGMYAVPISAIFAAPTLKLAENPRQKAHWEPEEPNSDIWFECSHCGCRISTGWDETYTEMWNYCPECGRKMGDEEDG